MEAWLESMGIKVQVVVGSNTKNDNLIGSNKIREFVISELRKRNQITIAESYSGYSKNEVTKIREEQTHDIKHDSKAIPTTDSHQKQFVKDKDNPTGSGAKR